MKYKELNYKSFSGNTIDDTYIELTRRKNMGEFCCVTFNGHVLNCDMTLDDMYKEVCGITKKKHDKIIAKKIAKHTRDENRFQKRLPKLEEKYIKLGSRYIDDSLIPKWKKCVEVRVRDIYHGYEVACAIKIMKAVFDNKSNEEIQVMFLKQNHSGGSAYVLKSILREFCSRDMSFLFKR